MPKYIKPSDGLLIIESTKAVKLPVGTLSQRPSSPEAGMIRLNIGSGEIEYYDGTVWVGVSSGTGGSGNFVLKAGDTMAGQLNIIKGNKTTPGLGFDGDNDTGIYSSNDGVINLTVSSQDVFEISDSKLKIGTSSPAIHIPVEIFGNMDLKTMEENVVTLERNTTGNMDIKIKQNGTDYWTIRNEYSSGNLSFVIDGPSSAKFVEFNRSSRVVNFRKQAKVVVNSNIIPTVTFYVSGDSIFRGPIRYYYDGVQYLDFPSSAGNPGQVLATNGSNNQLTWVDSFTVSGAGDIEVTLSGTKYIVSANTGIVSASTVSGISLIASAAKTLELKGLKSGNGIAVKDGGESITISASPSNVTAKTSTQVFVSAGTYVVTVPSEFTSCEVIVIGAGGNGGGSSNNVGFGVSGFAGGGGAGAYCNAYIENLTPGSNITVVVGSPSSSLPFSTRAGDGGDSRFGDYVICSGGYGGNSVEENSSFSANALFSVSGVTWFHGIPGVMGNRKYKAPDDPGIIASFVPEIYPIGGADVPLFGIGGKLTSKGNIPGQNAYGHGAGGGPCYMDTQVNQTGGLGAPGFVKIIWR